MIMGK